MFYNGDEAHAGIDNVTFLSRNSISFVEDAGDTLHAQRNGLDSGFVWQVGTDYSNPKNQPVRWLAEGRDASATLDADNGGFGSNEGDNEITGLPRLRRRQEHPRRARGQAAGSEQSQVALVLHPAAWGQPDLRGPLVEVRRGPAPRSGAFPTGLAGAASLPSMIVGFWGREHGCGDGAWAARPGRGMLFTDRGSGRAGELAAELGGEAALPIAELAERADVVVLAVKPAKLDEVAAELAAAKVVISLLGATSLERFARPFPGPRSCG